MEREPSERREPLPGVLSLPGFLVAKLSPGGRRLFWVGAAAVVVGTVALAVVLVPKISQDKRDRTAEERRAAARGQAEQVRRIQAQQRSRSGAAPRGGESALRGALEAAILADVARRVRSGGLPNPARRVTCRVTGGTHGRGFDCTAVTSAIPKLEGQGGGVVGYPYIALGDPRDGRFSFCKISPGPGEGQYTRRQSAALAVPRACGG